MIKYYDKENRKLVYIGERATPDFWDKWWDINNLRRTLERSKNNRFCLSTLCKYIHEKEGLILEGGCGRGYLIYCMHTHGYKCIGIDFAAKTISSIKETFPELDVRVGDVRNLPFPDNYFIGYWSLGVIEHYWSGYDDILREMRRVLVKGGYVFLTFPYMSLLRKLKAKFALYDEFNKEIVDIQHFYQFALNVKTVIKDFKAAGFRLINSRPQNGVGGLVKEASLFKTLLQKCYYYTGLNFFSRVTIFLINGILATFAGHIIFLVFHKV